MRRVSVLIAGAVIGFSIKYRRRSDNDLAADPRLDGARAHVVDHPVRHHDGPVLLGRGITSTSRPPDDSLEVNVVGKQWMWKVQHLEGQREINELHVPSAGRSRSRWRPRT